MGDATGLPSRFLVIGCDSKLNQQLNIAISQEWPEARVYIKYAAAAYSLDVYFEYDGVDVLLLNHDCDLAQENILNWIRQNRRRLPVTILLGESGDAQTAVKAIRSGADDYLEKKTLSRDLLYKAVIDAVLYSQDRQAESINAYHVALGPEIDGYEIQYKLSHGDGSGVYKAIASDSGREVVVKTLDQGCDEAVLARFRKEIEISQKLDGRYVPKVIASGEQGDVLFLVVEFFSLGSLRDKMQQSVIAVQDAFQYLIQIAAGLHELHSNGIVHRDLKPGNIMFREASRLVLIDFGIALDRSQESELTMAGEILGTPSYISPESSREDMVDERSDIYSLGVIFYEMLSGRKPYKGNTAISIMYQHSEMPVPQLPYRYRKFQGLLEKMMAKQPGERFSTIKELLADVRSLGSNLA